MKAQSLETTARTLEDLGLPQLRDILARRCRTPAGRARALVRPLLDDRAEVLDRLAWVAEARQLRAEGYRLPLDAVGDPRDAVARAEKGAMLTPRELIDLAQTLFALDRARGGLLLHEGPAPRLSALGRGLPALEPLAVRLDRSFEASGELSDRASPDLKQARERARSLHRTIKSKLETLLRDDAFLPNLRETYYSVRNDRYVVPVLAAHRQDVPGIVHNASQSGQTLFVEPQALVGLGNDLAIAQSLVVEEERRVLLELSDLAGRQADAIQRGIELAALFDETEAAALLSDELDAHAPEIGASDGDLRLLALRHPFLVLSGRAVVANDVALARPLRALVISGPNAGGKTVTLTAVGICALMLRTGLPIPAADGSHLPLYRSIHAAVGDAQSLEDGFSTFGAHLAALTDIQHSSGPGALVLIDEIAADTDPQEGAALAGALLEDLLERGVTALVTTHLEELKALAHVDSRFGNARVAPTYRLQLGAAGASSAIELAERMGLSAQVCERARARLQGGGGALAQALRAVEAERQRLAEEATALARVRAVAEQEKTASASRKEAHEKELQREARARRDVLQAELEKSLVRARTLVAALEAARRPEDAAPLEAELRGQMRVLEQEALDEEAEAAPPAPTTLKPGSWVRHLGLGRDVEVLEVDENDFLVAAGPLKLRVVRSELAGAKGRKPSPVFPDRSSRPGQALERAEAAAPATVESDAARLDLRGMRVEEALREVDSFLDRLTRAGEPTALIVHGHGTGALKAAIREHLRGSSYVEQQRPGQSHEGGDGATIVTLKV